MEVWITGKFLWVKAENIEEADAIDNLMKEQVECPVCGRSTKVVFEIPMRKEETEGIDKLKELFDKEK